MHHQTRRAMKSMIAGCLLSDRAQPVNVTTTLRPDGQLHGTIVLVDPISRELRVLAGNVLRDFYVPLGCSVMLNNEPVKLRMLQPSDQATIEYAHEHGTLHALAITVDWDPHPSDGNSQVPAGILDSTPS
jgi:hypothetical protein